MSRDKSETSEVLADLHARLERVLESARAAGRARALNEIRLLVGGELPAKRGPGRPLGSRNKPAVAATAKPKQKRRNSWAGLTAAARLVRVNAIRKGKGLPPRSA